MILYIRFLLCAFGVCAFSFSLLVNFVLSLVIDLCLSVPGDEHRPFIDAFIGLFIDFFNGSCGHPRFDRPFIHRFIDPFIDSFISASFFSNAFEKKWSSIIGPPQDHPRPTQDHPKTTPRPPQDRPRPPKIAPRSPKTAPRPPKTAPRSPKTAQDRSKTKLSSRKVSKKESKRIRSLETHGC